MNPILKQVIDGGILTSIGTFFLVNGIKRSKASDKAEAEGRKPDNAAAIQVLAGIACLLFGIYELVRIFV